MTMFEFMQQMFYTLISVVLVMVTALVIYGIGKWIALGIKRARGE